MVVLLLSLLSSSLLLLLLLLLEQRSLYSDWATTCMIRHLNLVSVDPTACHSTDIAVSFSRKKRTRHYVDQSLGLKMGGAISILPYILSWHEQTQLLSTFTSFLLYFYLFLLDGNAEHFHS